MDLSVSYYSAIGRRQNNEDALSVLEGSRNLLALVADGLGGHDDGEVASNQAIASINRELQGQTLDEDSLIDAIQLASQEICGRRGEKNTMRTTIAALWLNDYGAVAANVGDSRIYQFRDGEIIYQSVDHSVAQMAVLVGEMEKESIRTSRDRNKLIRVLGDETIPKVDSRILSVRSGDRFLLCSDGFWEPVTEEMMCRTLNASRSAPEWLSAMRDLVDQAGKPNQDNHTAIAIVVNHVLG